MTLWSTKFSGNSAASSSKWPEEVTLPSLNIRPRTSEKRQASFHTELDMPTTAPTTTVDDDVLPPPALHNSGGQFSRNRRKTARISGLAVHWARFKKRLATGPAPSSSSVVEESAVESIFTRRLQCYQDDEEVNEVVVDRAWSEDIKSSVTNSDLVGSPDKTGSQLNHGASDSESAVYEGFWSRNQMLIFLRWRVWPSLVKIFNSRFLDDKSEEHYSQESWFLKKHLALYTSIWLVLNWILGCAFIPRNPVVTQDKIFYFVIAPIVSIPVVFMVLYDWPRRRPYIYQGFLGLSIWCWSFYQVIFILSCGYYSPSPNCQGRDFMAIFYYATALQAVALFGLRLNRFPAAMGALLFFLFASITMIPLKTSWARTMINFFVFHSFLIYVHYMWENSERRLYTLRDELKIQFKAKQKAQINERKAADSKRRLTSYVFHEVRVPLNTAILAVQNMEASHMIMKDQEIEFNALCGSLSMMSKVLNDVLDFNRMDGGRFEILSRPYAFHQVMRSLFVPLRLAADARGLQFETYLDPNIDLVARRVSYEALGETKESIQKHLTEHPSMDGIVAGDEARLRQIITNLASNGCKFTETGGKLTVKTMLIVPEAKSLDPFGGPITEPVMLFSEGDQLHPLSTSYLTQHNMQHDKARPPLEYIVVRIEVTDTGVGIRPRDMAESKLFSAFTQTEQGRQQGGKGTGLGLALVRQIVKLSGGRLGVRSKVGEGSTFWVELPLGVGRETLKTALPDLSPEGTAHSGSEKVHDLTTELAFSAMTLGERQSIPVSTSQTTSRTTAAMHSIMEQGGRVELVLRKPDYGSPRSSSSGACASKKEVEKSHDCTTPVQTPQQSSPDTSTETPPDDTPTETPFDDTSTKTLDDLTTPTEENILRQNRPKFVLIPHPPTFSSENQPPATSSTLSSMSSGSSHGINPMTLFDQGYTRGSPASSNVAIPIEPGLSVLVVDDDHITRSLMKRLLTRLGCAVSVAENGEMALEMILGHQGLFGSTPSSDSSGSNCGPILERRQNLRADVIFEEGKYAVVFLDNQMPVMSGLKAVEKLRQLGRKDFIVGVTGNALLSDQQEYLEAGVDRVLTKPVYERSLRDILGEAEERRKTWTSKADSEPL